MKLTKVVPLPDYQLELFFDDGVHGIVDVHLPAHIFEIIKDLAVFNSVSVGDHGSCIRRNDDIEIDALAQYMKITGKQLFTDNPLYKVDRH